MNKNFTGILKMSSIFTILNILISSFIPSVKAILIDGFIRSILLNSWVKTVKKIGIPDIKQPKEKEIKNW